MLKPKKTFTFSMLVSPTDIKVSATQTQVTQLAPLKKKEKVSLFKVRHLLTFVATHHVM